MVKRMKDYFGLNEFPPRNLGEVVGTAGLDLKSKVYVYGSLAVMAITTISTYLIIK